MVRLRRLAVRDTDGGSRQAISTTTSVVAEMIAVDAPPITPATATGSSRLSAITPSPAARTRR